MSEYQRRRTWNFMIGPYVYAHVESMDDLDELLGMAESVADHTLATLPRRPEGTYPGETGPLVPEPDADDWEIPAGASWMVDPYEN